MFTSDYRKEFPDRPPIEVEIPKGFVDDSWRNDICPKFYNAKLGLVLWVEEPDASKREIPEMLRFCLQRVEVLPAGDYVWPQGEINTICESDDFSDILAALKRLG